MNLIWICSDTFRNDHLGCMGSGQAQTPCLDKLASEGVLFEQAYAEGLPTGPERLVHFTGKFTLPFRGWSPLTDADVTLPEHLHGLGWRTALMADTYHIFKPNYNFHRGFDEWRWVRGQENDAYVSGPRGEDPWQFLPARTREVALERKHGRREDFTAPLRQYLRNVADRDDADEAQYFPALTCREAMRWLEENRDAERFVLWIELFDPHEPFDPPPKYYDLYRDPAYTGPKLIAPWFHSVAAEDYRPEELEDVKALYAGEVSLVDHWVGELLDAVDRLGLRDDTAVLFTSDHGTMLGERGCVTKGPVLHNTLSQWIANVPLIVRHPQGPSGLRVSDLVWSPDFMPTCCRMLGVEPPESVHGRSFWPIAEGHVADPRDHVITGWGKRYQYVVDAEWRFVANNQAAPDELYHRERDPREERDVAAEHPQMCRRMRAALETFWKDAEALEP
ncbi:MAG: sulfatase [Candidatus Brocadiia bacterium]